MFKGGEPMFEKLKAAIRWKWDHFVGDVYFTRACRDVSFVKAIALVSRWYLNRVICRAFDHDLADEGYATPEHGCIQMTCQRCGYAYPTTWLY
jgi:hypothetical protein